MYPSFGEGRGYRKPRIDAPYAQRGGLSAHRSSGSTPKKTTGASGSDTAPQGPESALRRRQRRLFYLRFDHRVGLQVEQSETPTLSAQGSCASIRTQAKGRDTNATDNWRTNRKPSQEKKNKIKNRWRLQRPRLLGGRGARRSHGGGKRERERDTRHNTRCVLFLLWGFEEGTGRELT